MLENIRRWSQTWPAKVALTLLALSMVSFWGAGRMFFGDGPYNTLAIVGDMKVGRADFRKALSDRVRVLQARIGRPLTSLEVQNSGLAYMVLNEQIGRMLLDQEAARLGLAISDDALRAAMKKETAFQGENGTFSRTKFLQVLKASGLEERTFLQEQRQAMKRLQFVGALRRLVSAPPLMTDLVVEAMGQKRVPMVMKLSSSLVAPGTPSESQLTAFFEQDMARFERPQRKRLSFAQFSADRWKGKDLSASDLREKIYTLTEAIEDSLYGGMSLEEVAKRYDLKIISVPYFAQRKAPQLLYDKLGKYGVENFVPHVFDAECPKEAHVFQDTPDSRVVVEVKGTQDAFVPPLSDIKEEVQRAWESDESKRLLLKRAKRLAEEATAGKKIGNFKAFPAVQHTDRATDVRPEIVTVLFQLAPGEVRVAQTVDGACYLVKLGAIQSVNAKKARKEVEALEPRMNEALFDDFLSAYIASLRAHYHVQIDQEALRHALS